jgi:uncharacterized RDD family membrane protein YckC
MVIENFNQNIQFPNNENRFRFRPTVIKRILSALLDYFILAPIVFFVAMTILRSGLDLFRQYPNSGEAKEIVFHVCLLALILFALLQTVFIFVFYGTPGQIILKIRIEFAVTNYSRFLQIFIRQLGFVFSPILLGIPWLAVIYHPEGKTFYEKISDSSLLSSVSNENELIKENDKKYIGISLSTASFFVLFLFFAQWWLDYQSMLDMPVSKHVAALMQQNECEVIPTNNPISKLQILIAMNLVNMVSDECLDFQLDHDLWKNFSFQADQVQSLAYFGKFVTARNKDQEDNYLKLACSVSADGEGCYLAQNIDQPENLKDSKKSALIAVIKYEMNNADLASLKRWDQVRVFKKYILSEKILNLSTYAENKGPQLRRPASPDKKKALKKKRVVSTEITDLIRELKDL